MKKLTVNDLNPEERQKCEVWSRVMGYHRPIDQWNTGKQQEHADRVHFIEEKPNVGKD